MASMLDEAEYERWMAQARHTLRSAEVDLREGFYDWACFKSHQAAELAVKALLWGLGRPRYGHSLLHLASEVEGLYGELRGILARLDKFYVAPRYADMWAEGSPHEYYTRGEAEEAVEWARTVLARVEELWSTLRRGGEKERRG